MRFYALRILCERCRNAFVVGGSREKDLTRWSESLVECGRCGAELPAARGTVIDLSAQALRELPRPTVPELAHRWSPAGDVPRRIATRAPTAP